jgi:hypothetical protein
MYNNQNLGFCNIALTGNHHVKKTFMLKVQKLSQTTNVIIFKTDWTMVERSTHNPEIKGLNPAPGTVR